MFLFPLVRRVAASPRLVPAVFLVLAAVPVLWICGQIAAASRNIAYWDEIDSTLALLLRLDSGLSPGEFFKHLFSVTNEHRTVTSRIFFAGSYWLTGSIDFEWLGVVGNSFLLAACGLLIASVHGTARRLRLAVPLVFLIFQLENYESFLWSGSSIDHYQVVGLAVGAIVALAHGSRVGLGLAGAGGLLATFTLAHGLMVWPVGALLLARERRWPHLAIWAGGAAAAGLAFFAGFQINPGHQLTAFSWTGAGGLCHYWLTVLGAPLALGNKLAAPWLGAALVLATIVRSSWGDWSKQRITLPVVWFVIGSAALIALGRAELSHGHVYSRYMILGGLGWALTIFAVLEQLSTDARPYWMLGTIVPSLMTFNFAANREYRADAETFVEHRDRAALRYRQHFEDGRGPVTLHPVPARATAVLAEAARRNIYQMPRMCVRREFPDAKPSGRISYCVDEFTLDRQSVYLAGWAAIPKETIRRGELHLVLHSADTFLIFSTVQVTRPDVVNAYNEPRWRMSGFRFVARRSCIPPGEYNVGFLIGDDEEAEYILTAHKLKLVGRGEAHLAGQ